MSKIEISLTKGLFIVLSIISSFVLSSSASNANLNKHQSQFEKAALQIWDFAEVGYQEFISSCLLQSNLAQEGFSIQKEVAGMPTAFIAEFGSGYPVIGILGEFDALPGLAQSTSPFKEIY